MNRGRVLALAAVAAATTTRAAAICVVRSNALHSRPLHSLKQAPFVSTTALFSTISSSDMSLLPSNKPSRPLAYFQKTPDLDLQELKATLIKNEESRNDAFDVSRKLQTAHAQARTALETAEPSQDIAQEYQTLFEASIPSTTATRNPREANLANRVEDYCRYRAFCYFLDTATLLPPSQCKFATDEEYLGGACMGLASDLARYGLGRATERDFDSLKMACNLVNEIQNQLLEFDFRNGPLRRKYDGTKYALKSLETLLYELAVTSSRDEAQQHVDKKTKMESELIPMQELQDLRERMAQRDEQREQLIKKCRDGQKTAKQSIFALHRNNPEQALKLLDTCQTCILEELLPIVEQEPFLRQGSFSNVLEEYAEAKLFYVWLYGKDGDSNNDKHGPSSPSGVLLSLKDFDIKLEPEEYLGGLCDTSGEITRFAVQRGTVRDTEGVKKCLESVGSILLAMQTMPRLSNQISKKTEQVRRSGEKLERMLYLASLSEASGGRNVVTGGDNGDNIET